MGQAEPGAPAAIRCTSSLVPPIRVVAEVHLPVQGSCTPSSRAEIRRWAGPAGPRTVLPDAMVASTTSGCHSGLVASSCSASGIGFSRRTQPWLARRLKLANFERLGVSADRRRRGCRSRTSPGRARPWVRPSLQARGPLAGRDDDEVVARQVAGIGPLLGPRSLAAIDDGHVPGRIEHDRGGSSTAASASRRRDAPSPPAWSGFRASSWKTLITAAAMLTWMRSDGSCRAASASAPCWPGSGRCGARRARSGPPGWPGPEPAVGIEAEALLGAHRGLLQGLVEHRGLVDGHRRVLDRQAGPPARRCADRRSRPASGSRPPPAASSRPWRRCRDSVPRPFPRGLVAGIGRRQAVQPRAQAVLGGRLHEVGTRIVGQGAQAPVADEASRARRPVRTALAWRRGQVDQLGLGAAGESGRRERPQQRQEGRPARRRAGSKSGRRCRPRVTYQQVDLIGPQHHAGRRRRGRLLRRRWGAFTSSGFWICAASDDRESRRKARRQAVRHV